MIDSDDRGFSPVIGLILLVAIVVILTAVVGSFVMDLTGKLERNADASVDFDEEPYSSSTNGSLEIQLIAIHNGEYLRVEAPDSTKLGELHSAGDSIIITISDSEDYGSGVVKAGDEIRVVGVLDDTKSVIQTHETKDTI